MATQQRKTISLNVLVDKKNNRVIYAEATKEFVDVLFSFLTLPMGTIVRLLRKQSQASVIGSMNNLYKSMEDLETQYFQNQTCKTMLLCTRNSSSEECQKLSLNIDDTEPVKYYYCQECKQSEIDKHLYVTTFSLSPCDCGHMLSTEISFAASTNKIDTDGVFVKGSATFIVTNDLQVMPMSTTTTLVLLKNLGVKDAKTLEKRTFDIGLEEVLSLLEISFVSKSPLTDLLLFKKNVGSTELNFKALEKSENERKAENNTFMSINIKLMIWKSNSKVLFAEAGEDFVSFLFNVLTFPLGAMVKLLDKPPSLGCIAKLYTSVEGFNTKRWMKSSEHKAMLLDPRIALQYGDNLPLGILAQVVPPVYIEYQTDHYILTSNQPPSFRHRCRRYSSCMHSHMTFVNLKSPPPGATAETEGFVRGPATFMITDNLDITPLSTISAISFLDNLNVPINEIEERSVSIGFEEALRILEAAITSNSALTSILRYNNCAKRPKKEKC